MKQFCDTVCTNIDIMYVQSLFMFATSLDRVSSLTQFSFASVIGTARLLVRSDRPHSSRAGIITGNIQTFLTVVCKTLSDMHYSSLPSAQLWCCAHRATPAVRAGRGAQHCIIAIVPFVGGLSQPTICRQFQAEPCVGNL